MTMINAYSVGISLNATGVQQGAQLAKNEIRSLTSTMRGLESPADKIENKLNLVQKALEANYGDAEQLKRAEKALQDQLVQLVEIEHAHTAALNENAAAQQRAMMAAQQREKWMRDRQQGLARQAWLNAPEQESAQARKGLAARLKEFKEQKKKEQAMMWSWDDGSASNGRPGSSLDLPSRSAGMAGQRMLQLSYFADDLQYGLRGVTNNIPQLAQAVGISSKAAGMLGIAAVGLNVLIKASEKGTFENEKLTASYTKLQSALDNLGVNEFFKMMDWYQNKFAQGGVWLVEKFASGLEGIAAGVSDIAHGDMALTRFNKVLDQYNTQAKQVDEFNPWPPQIDYLQMYREELERAYKIQSNMVEAAKWYADHDPFMNAKSDESKSMTQQIMDLQAQQNAANNPNDNGLLAQAKKLAELNEKDSSIKNYEERAKIGERYAKGQVQSWREYKDLLTDSQIAQLQQIEAIQKQIDKAEELRNKEKQAAEEKRRAKIKQQEDYVAAAEEQVKKLEAEKKAMMEAVGGGVNSVSSSSSAAYKKITEIENKRMASYLGNKFEKDSIDLAKKQLDVAKQQLAETKKREQMAGV